MEIMMASSSTVQLSNPFHYSSSSSSSSIKQQRHKPSLSFTTRATDPEIEAKTTETETPQDSEDNESFENRLAQVRLRYKSGTGKKAEARKGKKPKKGSSGNGANGKALFLPPVPLKEPVSSGVKVEMGFSRYTERLNGRLAGLGLAALLLVELASGKSVIKYHSPSIVFIQLYFVAAVSAVFVKFEKERVSVWPNTQSSLLDK
ncbi:hypothetical protein IFM89_000142 [Coptis chinensis]|uniref:Uncharacterized protein n=1 Tax=Coptis chinensis TaxID=261450 RepID=A0A835H1I9_9MAGN|nr:hypothetical protein IFM89_000142 [Coptis chinensis]